jgi:hypothetical protein
MALTPQELAALQAGIDPRAYFDDPMVAARAGLLDPETIQRGPSTIRPGTTLPASRVDKAKGMAQDTLTRMREALGQIPAGLQNIPMGRVGFAGGMIAPTLTAVEEAQAGRPTGALGAIGGGLLGSAAGVGIGKLALGGLAATPGLPGLVGKGLQVAIPAIGGIIGGNTGAQLAESTKRFLTGDPTTGKDDLKNKLAERGLISKQDLDIYDRTQGIQTSNILNLNQGIADQEYLNMQRMNPLLQKMENAKLVRAQALMATQGQQYAMLGTLATAGKLATGSQAERGATVRTVLGSNPYASANLQAPGISFG